MRKAVKICRYLSYIGILGVIGLIFKIPVLNYFWFFWLFGLVEIAANPPVFAQSFKQLLGMLWVPLKYGSKLPNKDNYATSIDYSLPFSGEWTVVNGGVDKKTSHSWSMPTQRYAYDFLILNEDMKSYTGEDGKNPQAYNCYGKEVLAPAKGEVAEAVKDFPDSYLSGKGDVDCSARDIRGNYIVIKHGEKEYSLLAHLRPGTVKVKAGDFVEKGQVLAECGNSGNSSEPHLHFQLQNGKSFFYSAGLPVKFSGIEVRTCKEYSNYDPRPIPETENDSNTVQRGRLVRNL